MSEGVPAPKPEQEKPKPIDQLVDEVEQHFPQPQSIAEEKALQTETGLNSAIVNEINDEVNTLNVEEAPEAPEWMKTEEYEDTKEYSENKSAPASDPYNSVDDLDKAA